MKWLLLSTLFLAQPADAGVVAKWIEPSRQEWNGRYWEWYAERYYVLEVAWEWDWFGDQHKVAVVKEVPIGDYVDAVVNEDCGEEFGG